MAWHCTPLPGCLQRVGEPACRRVPQVHLVGSSVNQETQEVTWSDGGSEYQGIYLSAEDMDKQALKNKGLWMDG